MTSTYVRHCPTYSVPFFWNFNTQPVAFFWVDFCSDSRERFGRTDNKKPQCLLYWPQFQKQSLVPMEVGFSQKNDFKLQVNFPSQKKRPLLDANFTGYEFYHLPVFSFQFYLFYLDHVCVANILLLFWFLFFRFVTKKQVGFASPMFCPHLLKISVVPKKIWQGMLLTSVSFISLAYRMDGRRNTTTGCLG